MALIFAEQKSWLSKVTLFCMSESKYTPTKKKRKKIYVGPAFTTMDQYDVESETD